MARGIKQPPKKKHTVKARATPVVALSATEREFRAQEVTQKSQIHLSEAKAIAAWGNAPNAAIHSAYYCMHFCAVAALYRAGGVGKHKDVPQSHEHVLLHYIKMSETVDDDYIKSSGLLLNRARDDRMRADYFAVERADPEQATEAADVAERFLAIWQNRWARLAA